MILYILYEGVYFHNFALQSISLELLNKICLDQQSVALLVARLYCFGSMGGAGGSSELLASGHT